MMRSLSPELNRPALQGSALFSGLAFRRWPTLLLADATYTTHTLSFLLLIATLAGAAVAVAGPGALIISLALLACMFILIDFQIGVALLIVLMPVSASALFPHAIAGITGLNPLNLLLMGTLASALMHRSISGASTPLVPPPLFWCYILPILIGASLGSSHIAAIPGHFLAEGLISFNSVGSYFRDVLFKPLFMVLFAVLVGAALARSQRFERLLLPMLVSIWLMGLMTIVFVLISGVSWRVLASSESRAFFAPLGMHANDLGRCYAMAYALLLFTFAACTDYRLRLFLLASMAMVVLALVLTFSRGAFLGFAVVNVLFLISRRRIISLLAGGMVLTGLVMMMPEAVFDRIMTGWDSGLNAVSAGRVDTIWLPLLPEVWASPLFGHGLGSILWSHAMRAGSILQVTHPHNAYLQALLDIGLIGLLLLAAYFLHVWKGFRRLSRNLQLEPGRRGFYEGAAVGLLAFLISGFAGSSLLPVPEQCFLWLAIGMLYGETPDPTRKNNA